MKEKSFLMLKPDAVKRKLTGKIITRLEEKGLKIIAARMLIIDNDLAKEHYGEHKEKPFFKDLVDYITSGPVLAMVIEGNECISLIRKIVGATNPKKADLGTIRATTPLTLVGISYTPQIPQDQPSERLPCSSVKMKSAATPCQMKNSSMKNLKPHYFFTKLTPFLF